jgi:hypothetical protein
VHCAREATGASAVRARARLSCELGLTLRPEGVATKVGAERIFLLLHNYTEHSIQTHNCRACQCHCHIVTHTDTSHTVSVSVTYISEHHTWYWYMVCRMVWCPSYPPSVCSVRLSLRVVASCSVHPVSERHRQAVQSALVRRWVRPCDAHACWHWKEWNRGCLHQTK